jgi:hypothetical protein
VDDLTAKRILYEQEKIKETLATDGAKVLFAKLQTIANEAKVRQLLYDPYLDPHKIMKAKLTAYVIESLIEQILEGLVNYDPEAIDKQVAPKERWSFVEWLKSIPSIMTGKES